MNTDVLGVIELKSIADGYFTLDAVVKAAPVEILKAEIINPGKYLILITGNVASVEIAMDAGIEAGKLSLQDHFLVTGLHWRVLPALGKFCPPDEIDAVGIIESVSVSGAIEAADRAAKEADVSIVTIKTGNETGGKGVVMISGAIGDVQPAVAAAVELLNKRQQLYRDVIIPGPHPDFKGFLSGN